MDASRATARATTRAATRFTKPGTSAAIALAVAFSAGIPATVGAQAQNPYPSRPIRYVVPFAPGGPTDIMSRAIAERLAETLGMPVVVDNRGGAGGGLGAQIVARAAPDGHTLMIGHVGTHAINPALYPKLGYDPVRDFQPISLVATIPLALVVHAGVPVHDLKALIALARARPGALNYAAAGSGGPTHLSAELFRSMARIDIVHVPYKGNAAALGDLVGGQVQMMFSNMLTSSPFVRSGKLRRLAITSNRRSPQAPELPTMAEAGVDGYDVTPWFGILAPAGMQAPVLARLNGDIVRILGVPEVRDRFVSQGIDIVSSSPAAFAELIRKEIPRWRAIVETSGARVD